MTAADLHLDIGPGSAVGIVGSSGSGRSTMLEVLAGLRMPDEGTVQIDGKAVDPGTVGVATQEHELLGGLTAAENVVLRPLASKQPVEDWEPASAILGRLGLPEATWHNLAEELSRG